MANWVDNRLVVEGPDHAVRRFVERAKGQDPLYQDDGEGKFQVFSFHALCPIPLNVLEASYSQFGFSWELNHWGIKWGAATSSMEVSSPNKVVYVFDTPFSPPVLLLGSLAAEFDVLQFTLNYEGDEFVGFVRFRDGMVVESRYRRRGRPM